MPEAIVRDLARCSEAVHVSRRVDPRIGPAAPDQIHIMPDDVPKGFFQNSLDGPLPGLILPSVEVRPVISDQHVDVADHAAMEGSSFIERT